MSFCKKKLSLTIKSFIVLGLVFTFAITTYSATIEHSNNNAVTFDEQESTKLINKNIPVKDVSSNQSGNIIVPFDVQLINNVNYIGTSAYDTTFTLAPENGTKLNVWVKNNHSSKTVKFKVVHETTNTDYGYVNVAAGDNRTRTFSLPSGGGLSGKWRVYVTSNDGHQMNLTISARQYQSF